mgnify:CR=1 FL=1
MDTDLDMVDTIHLTIVTLDSHGEVSTIPTTIPDIQLTADITLKTDLYLGESFMTPTTDLATMETPTPHTTAELILHTTDPITVRTLKFPLVFPPFYLELFSFWLISRLRSFC